LASTWENNLREEDPVLAQGFRPGCLTSTHWAWGKVDIMVKSVWWRKAAHLMVAGKQEDTESKMHPSKTHPSDPVLLVTAHLSQFPPPPSRPFSYESINGLTNWWGQSPCEPITSSKLHLWALPWGPSLQHMSLFFGGGGRGGTTHSLSKP
jgi:hypothetical protein